MRKVLGLALLSTMACGQNASDPQRVDDILALTGNADDGQVVYDNNCSGCHGINGEGGSGPAMANAVGIGDAAIVDVVLSGKESMPSFDTLPDQDIADLVEHLLVTY